MRVTWSIDLGVGGTLLRYWSNYRKRRLVSCWIEGILSHAISCGNVIDNRWVITWEGRVVKEGMISGFCGTRVSNCRASAMRCSLESPLADIALVSLENTRRIEWTIHMKIGYFVAGVAFTQVLCDLGIS